MAKNQRKPNKRTSKNQVEKRARRKVFQLIEGQRNLEIGYKALTKTLVSEFPFVVIESTIKQLVAQGKLERTKTGSIKLSRETRRGKDVPRQPISDEKHMGPIDINSSGNGYVTIEAYPDDVFIHRKHTGKSFNGDIVEIELTRAGRNGKMEGRVTRVIKRMRSEFAGLVQFSNGYTYVAVERGQVPVDIFIPKTNIGNLRNGDRVFAKILRWTEKDKNPVGEIIEKLNHLSENDIEMKSLLIEQGFPLEFSAEVMQQASLITMEIPREEVGKRRDFRAITTFTIDPIDAKDFDDAISLQHLENGNWEVGVHIADVSHYMPPKSALDKEAYDRATSVYLVDRVLPMLPEHLSNGVCSLRPNEEKLTFAAVFELNDKAQVLKKWFGRTVIKSDRRFTYEEAQERIESKEGDYAEEINQLNSLAHLLRKAKFANGAIAFETPEVRFQLDENSKPIGLVLKERKDAHMLIEDFMLLANKEVARFLSPNEQNPKLPPAVFRIHDKPSEEKLEELAVMAKQFGHTVQLDSPKKVAQSLNKLMADVKGQPEERMMTSLAVRCMAKAVYTTKNIGHYGLGFEYYSHFTSPIRRYPDVMVHRLLQDRIDGKFKAHTSLEDACQHCSNQERKAMEAERNSVKYKQVEFMEDKVGEVFDGVITGVQAYGIFVELVDTRCEGLVNVDSMERFHREQLVYLEKTKSIVSRSSNQKYQHGDTVFVKVTSTNLRKREIDLELASK